MPSDRAPPMPLTLDPRRSLRLGLEGDGFVILEGRWSHCRVLELSQHGALIELDDPPQTGCDGLLRFGELDMLFRVVRADASSISVEFVDELAAAEADDDPELRAIAENNHRILRFLAR